MMIMQFEIVSLFSFFFRAFFKERFSKSVANMVILNLSASATKNTQLTTISKELVLMAKKKKKKNHPSMNKLERSDLH